MVTYLVCLLLRRVHPNIIMYLRASRGALEDETEAANGRGWSAVPCGRVGRASPTWATGQLMVDGQQISRERQVTGGTWWTEEDRRTWLPGRRAD